MSDGAAAWRALLGLAAGPLILMAATALLIPHVDAYWRLLRETSPASPYYAETTVHYAGSPEVVVFGSSVANRDVDERILSRALDAEVINLGVPGIHAAGSAMWVPDIVALAPSLAVLVVGPSALARDEVVWLERWQPGVAWECFGPAGLAADPEPHLEGLVGWLHPLQRHREGFYKRALLGRPNTKHPRDKPTIPPNHMALQLEGVAGQLAGRTMDGTGPNVRAVHAMQRRFDAAGVRFLIAHAPTHPGLGFDVAVAPTVEVLTQLEEAGVDVLRARALGRYPPRVFADPLHLDHDGQRQFTEALAAAIQARLGAR